MFEFIVLLQAGRQRLQKLEFKLIRELSFCHKLKYSYPYILATQCRRP